MSYELLIFDLDDTLLDFKASERLSFFKTMELHQITASEIEVFFGHYQKINLELWKQLERGQISKDELKIERFRKTFHAVGAAIDPERASEQYLDALPHHVVLVDHAEDLC